MRVLQQVQIDGYINEIPIPLSAKEKKALSEEESNRLKALSDVKKSIRTIIHRPTYCYDTYRQTDGTAFPQERKPLSAFTIKNAIQSTKSKTLMSNALNWLLLFAEKKRIYEKKTKKTFSFRLAFITLTLSAKQAHTDEYIKEHMLQPFIYWMQRNYKASYVWKAETQINGNIHFHITIDTFVHWRSVRAKWNSLLSKHSYCKVFQDGTNDKGNSATQIKAIKNEKGLAACIGGYLTKGSIEEKEHYALRKKGNTVVADAINNGFGVSQSIETRMHYTRFVEGRIWACSESLSKISCIVDERSKDFQQTEREFFRGNNLKSLGKQMLAEHLQRVNDQSAEERRVMKTTVEDLEHKYRPFMDVYIHRNLKTCKLPPLLMQKLAEEKKNRKFNGQTFFTVDSLN